MNMSFSAILSSRTTISGCARKGAQLIQFLFPELQVIFDFVCIVSSVTFTGTLYQGAGNSADSGPTLFAGFGFLIAINHLFIKQLEKPNSLRRTPVAVAFLRDCRRLSAALVLTIFIFMISNNALPIWLDVFVLASLLVSMSIGRCALFFVVGWFAENGRAFKANILIVRDKHAPTTHDLTLSSLGFFVHTLMLNDLTEYPKERTRFLETLVDSCLKHRISAICVVAPLHQHAPVATLLDDISSLPLRLLYLPTSHHRFFGTFSSYIGPLPSIEVRRASNPWAYRTLKRVLDIVASTIGFIVLAPILLAISILIKLDSPGPIFFRQTRYGFSRTPFRIWKFRSMTVMDDGASIAQARRNDPRVTRIGRLLRRTSLDELPQLFNVLRGEMSLVGPRPHARAHDEQYAALLENYTRRQFVKPGITGWAQVNGFRGETRDLEQMSQRIECDAWYVTHRTSLLDFTILLRTVRVVLVGNAAY